jgi:hypothetical protein
MINPNNYYTVQGWMLSELGLKGNALAAYAIIYGFSQDGVSEYAGSAKYLSEWMNCSKRTVLSTLASLTEQGLLTKKTLNKNGVIFNNYVAVRRPHKHQPQGGEEISPPVQNFHQGGEEISPGAVQNFHQGGEEISPHIDIHTPIDTHIDMDISGAGAPPPPPPPPKKGRKEKDDTEKPPKQEYGEYHHVMLTDDEYAKLVKKHGLEKTAALIKHLDEYIEERPKYKSESHYLTIGRWVLDAVNEKIRRAAQNAQPWPAGRGGYGAPAQIVGPNGIAIDQTKTDLDGHF